MVKPDAKGEKKQFLLGLASFFAAFCLASIWVLYITPIPTSSAGLFALLAFTVGVLGSIVLILTKHSLVGLGGSLAAILFVVLFALLWPVLR